MISVSIEAIDAWLPQTQCTQCGYPRCHAYAEALATGEANINRCPPGNSATIKGLAELLGKAVEPLDESCGQHNPRTYVIVDESLCIGCTLCIKACPVDAIMGTAKRMHTVLIEECTGCELCIPPCPMDCIVIKPWSGDSDNNSPWPEYSKDETQQFRRRTSDRLARVARWEKEKTDSKRKHDTSPDDETIKAEIQAAVRRVKNKKQNKPS